MSKLEMTVLDDVVNHCKEYTLRIPYEVLATAPLTSFDRLQLESQHDPNTPIADALLDLQTIVLRIEQHNTAPSPNTEQEKKK